jgi:hypothetical protein
MDNAGIVFETNIIEIISMCKDNIFFIVNKGVIKHISSAESRCDRLVSDPYSIYCTNYYISINLIVYSGIISG